MFEKGVRCTECGKKPGKNDPLTRCSCGSALEVLFDCRKLGKIDFSSRPFNHSRYKEFFPVSSLLSLGEGGTPVTESRNLAKPIGFNLFFKNEALNPTGSFKDRGSSVEVARALEAGAKKAVCASTGNMGASVSAYSALRGMKSVILVPKDARKVKMEQIMAYGSKVYHLPGTYGQAASIAESLAIKKGFHLLGDYLYRREGTKSVAFELAEQGNWDYVAVPIGNGTLISACWKGFNEFRKAGLLKRLPRMVGVQASGCSPIARAWKSSSQLRPFRKAKTIAAAIECGDPLDGRGALRALRESRGFAVQVSDSQLLRARDLLARKEGIFAEPAGAASLAGVLKSASSIPKGSRVACVVTGHGLKSPFTGIRGKPINIRGLNILGKIRI